MDFRASQIMHMASEIDMKNFLDGMEKLNLSHIERLGSI